jgi:hypothetical protein
LPRMTLRSESIIDARSCDISGPSGLRITGDVTGSSVPTAGGFCETNDVVTHS